MENTLRNKEKFFAQYFGQKVLFRKSFGKDSTLLKLMGDELQLWDDDETYLQLHPLSSISGEQSLKVYDLGLGSAKERIGQIGLKSVIKQGREFAQRAEKRSSGYFTGIGICLHVVDYLRSEGFALPFNGLSVEKIIEYGWITLKP